MQGGDEKTELNLQDSRAFPKKKIAALAGLAIVAGFSLFLNFGPDQEIANAENEANIDALAAVDAVKLMKVKPSEMELALQSLLLPQASLDELSKNLVWSDLSNDIAPNASDPYSKTAYPRILEKQTEPQQLRLVWVELWDFARMDGDVVSISSDGFSSQVLLGNTPTRIAVPVGNNMRITVTGVKDGGGGITLGIRNGDGVMHLPVLLQGNSLVLPIGF